MVSDRETDANDIWRVRQPVCLQNINNTFLVFSKADPYRLGGCEGQREQMSLKMSTHWETRNIKSNSSDIASFIHTGQSVSSFFSVAPEKSAFTVAGRSVHAENICAGHKVSEAANSVYAVVQQSPFRDFI